ncbi:MAG: I78 family peptidase inhibitor [Betaproteobacteria bacterium]
MTVNPLNRTCLLAGWPLIAVLAFALSACAGTTPQTQRARNTQMSEDPAAPPAESSSTAPPAEAMACDARKAQAAVGKTATQAVVDQVVAGSGSRNVRVLKPGDAMTMDYREDRVNIEVDATNAIKTIRCG